jgi:hypothetical protein
MAILSRLSRLRTSASIILAGICVANAAASSTTTELATPSSDDPQFLDGVAKELSGLLHGPHCQRFGFRS